MFACLVAQSNNQTIAPKPLNPLNTQTIKQSRPFLSCEAIPQATERPRSSCPATAGFVSGGRVRPEGPKERGDALRARSKMRGDPPFRVGERRLTRLPGSCSRRRRRRRHPHREGHAPSWPYASWFCNCLIKEQRDQKGHKGGLFIVADDADFASDSDCRRLPAISLCHCNSLASNLGGATIGNRTRSCARDVCQSI